MVIIKRMRLSSLAACLAACCLAVTRTTSPGALALVVPSVVKGVRLLPEKASTGIRRAAVTDDEAEARNMAPIATTGRLCRGDSLSSTTRRGVLFQHMAGLSLLGGGAVVTAAFPPPLVHAAETTSTAEAPVVDALAKTSSPTTTNTIEMKTFVDPQGMFAINVPVRFFAIRRSAKGDLPDAKGQGRRGSTIFTAGDMAKAEVVAIERFPTELLLSENGISSTTGSSLASITDIGEPRAVANLLALKRDRDKDGTLNTKVVPDSIQLSNDQQELMFLLRTKIEVQRPELLLEQTGSAELYRITAGKASVRAGNNIMMVVYASALETDWNGPDGAALQETVQSFTVLA
jgi:hypothetical protein